MLEFLPLAVISAAGLGYLIYDKQHSNRSLRTFNLYLTWYTAVEGVSNVFWANKDCAEADLAYVSQ